MSWSACQGVGDVRPPAFSRSFWNIPKRHDLTRRKLRGWTGCRRQEQETPASWWRGESWMRDCSQICRCLWNEGILREAQDAAPLPPGCAPLHHVVNIKKKGLTSARNQTQECQYYGLVTVPTELSREAKTMWYLLYSVGWSFVMLCQLC